jgi:tetratricopeptide (TPR) repeat protein
MAVGLWFGRTELGVPVWALWIFLLGSAAIVLGILLREAFHTTEPKKPAKEDESPWARFRRPTIVLGIGVSVLMAVGLWLGGNTLGAPMSWAVVIFLLGSAAIVLGTLQWLGRVDQHALLRAEEKVQNKDALVIGAFFALLLLLGYCVTGAAAAVQFFTRAGAAVSLALTWALASASVGGAFGFLLGHPRRLTDEKPERAGLSGLLRTGLDDMVDWLVKGLTTVFLVQATAILAHLEAISKQMALGLAGSAATPAELAAAATFAQPVIVSFTILGALATCLVTRTYLTGALGRADRTTTGAFNRVGLDWGDVLLLVSAQRSLSTRDLPPSPEVKRVATQLAALSLGDLHSVQEFAMWAKAKSMLGQYEEALTGYEKAVAEHDSDPALLLDYSVVLHLAGRRPQTLEQLTLAYEYLSTATASEIRRNVFKSLTFELLYHPGSSDRILQLVKEFEEWIVKHPTQRSPGLMVNKACAWGQKFLLSAQQLKGDLVQRTPNQPIKVNVDPSNWTKDQKDLQQAYEEALKAVKDAVGIDPLWKKHLQLLLQSSDPNKADNPTALEVFERFNDFRFAVDLPPFSETQGNGETEVSEGEGQNGNGTAEPTSHVETVQSHVTPTTTGESAPGPN